MRNRFLLALTLAGLTLGVGANAQAQTSTWAIDPNHSSIGFEIRHMGVSNVRGSIGGVKGTVTLNDKDMTKSSVEATVDTTTVTTNVDARDKHLKSPDFFDVAKYPQITFKSTSLTNNGGKLQLTGDLTLTGTTKSVTLDLDGPAPPQTGKDGKTRSGFSATGMLKRSDYTFGPKFPSAMVGDEVKFTIDVEIDKQ
ncbi:adhesin HecA-like repeat protein [Edaphobacter aggregans]|jgi:adhesin HecA-like repeat protein|uniref:Adhesin HecA-like repeat protein n=1 Tax=Edaphobacter aggregans TaxID=570835 RepID=A0A3R9P870_9BACT|nr:YceI family protein [Edaphobacter aggregans]RSL15681.1 adhesin HecA-like repeat protein [Edaphobacter aggregans]